MSEAVSDLGSAVIVNPLGPAIGAEIGNVDLTHPLSDAEIADIRAAWLEHQVIFFRDQDLTLEQHIAFGRQFGELHIHPNVPSHPDHAEILVIHADENSKRVAGHGWHTDVSCDHEPPAGEYLEAYRNTRRRWRGYPIRQHVRAYDALSDHWRGFLDGLTARHESAHVHGHYYNRDAKHEFVAAEHPVVRTHPETGRKALYVNSAFTTGINGMKPNESRATLEFLFRHMEHIDFQCRFRWTPHSIAMWDNRCAQHHAAWDYYPQVRHGYRVTLAGDKPF